MVLFIRKIPLIMIAYVSIQAVLHICVWMDLSNLRNALKLSKLSTLTLQLMLYCSQHMVGFLSLAKAKKVKYL